MTIFKKLFCTISLLASIETYNSDDSPMNLTTMYDRCSYQIQNSCCFEDPGFNPNLEVPCLNQCTEFMGCSNQENQLRRKEEYYATELDHVQKQLHYLTHHTSNSNEERIFHYSKEKKQLKGQLYTIQEQLKEASPRPNCMC